MRKFYTIKNINSWVNQHTWKNIKGLKTFNFKWNCSCICTATYSGCACTWRQLWFVAAFLPQLQDAVIPADGLPKNEQYRDGGQAGEQEHRPCSPYSHHTICLSHNLQNTRCWGRCQCDALTRRSLCVPARPSQRRSSELSSTPSQPATQGSHMDRWLSTFCPPLAESPSVGLRRQPRINVNPLRILHWQDTPPFLHLLNTMCSVSPFAWRGSRELHHTSEDLWYDPE